MANAIHFADEYLDELDEALDNFRLVSQVAAERFAEQHDRCVRSLQAFAEMGERLAPRIHSLPIRRSGYRMVYQLVDGAVRLVALENVRRRKI